MQHNLHHDVKVQYQKFPRGKTSSHDSHILSQRTNRRVITCFWFGAKSCACISTRCELQCWVWCTGHFRSSVVVTLVASLEISWMQLSLLPDQIQAQIFVRLSCVELGLAGDWAALSAVACQAMASASTMVIAAADNKHRELDVLCFLVRASRGYDVAKQNFILLLTPALSDSLLQNIQGVLGNLCASLLHWSDMRSKREVDQSCRDVDPSNNASKTAHQKSEQHHTIRKDPRPSNAIYAFSIQPPYKY